MNKRRVLKKILAGSRNIRFGDLVALVGTLGFQLARVNRSHHIFQHPLVREAVNLQDVNGEAKPYQVRQVVGLIETYGLSLDRNDDEAGEDEAAEGDGKSDD